MADKALSSLTATTTLSGTDLVYVIHGSDSRKITWTNFQGQITITESQISDLGSYITASSSDTLTNKDVTDGTNTFPTFNQDTSGNAATATALATARTIAGVSFDGTANIAIASTDLSDTADLTYNADTDVSGNGWVVDEDDMASDSAIKVPTQQSVKAYADTLHKVITVNAQTGATYTLVLTDAGKTVTMANGSANTLTIPTNASVAFAAGTVIAVIQKGTGVTTITGDTGVSVNGVSGGSGAINTQYNGASLLYLGSDTWIASGDIATVA